ncbi:MAG: N-6 DNA methylase, partial [bacterium]|nr:N-6 DNA methylase [bacterium]
IDSANRRQRELAAKCELFFANLHRMLKTVDRRVRLYENQHGGSREGKDVKAQLEVLHNGVTEAEYFFTHIAWLQERFPGARYEDVTGLCKAATPQEIAEQDYSLNPGRYVGVVIEEDGKSEEEFIEEILVLNDELNLLNDEAGTLERTINNNINLFAGDK